MLPRSFMICKGCHTVNGSFLTSFNKHSTSTIKYASSQTSFSDPPGLNRETSNLKKYLSSEYGRKKDLLDEITRNLVAKVQRHPADFDSTEVQIAKLTVRLRNLQEIAAIRGKKRLKSPMLKVFYQRNQLLNQLRMYHFENYCHVLNALNIRHVLPPEKYRTITKLADDVADMKVRAFAESLRRSAEQRRKEQELEQLTAKIKAELASDETSLNKT